MKTSVKSSTDAGIPIWQEMITTAQGGFTLDDSVLVAGTIIKGGTMIGFDEATRKAKVAKMAVLQANATNVATTYNVLKGHNLVVGMSIKLATGTARAITAIDTTTNTTHDVLTVGTTIGVAGTAGDMIYVDDIGATAPKGLLKSEVEVEENAELAVVLRGMVYHRRISPVAVASQAKLPTIIFSESY